MKFKKGDKIVVKDIKPQRGVVIDFYDSVNSYRIEFPDKSHITLADNYLELEFPFKVGDKIICNGDKGYITAIDGENCIVQMSYGTLQSTIYANFSQLSHMPKFSVNQKVNIKNTGCEKYPAHIVAIDWPYYEIIYCHLTSQRSQVLEMQIEEYKEEPKNKFKVGDQVIVYNQIKGLIAVVNPLYPDFYIYKVRILERHDGFELIDVSQENLQPYSQDVLVKQMLKDWLKP